jgi:hypothetical protein
VATQVRKAKALQDAYKVEGVPAWAWPGATTPTAPWPAASSACSSSSTADRAGASAAERTACVPRQPASAGFFVGPGQPYNDRKHESKNRAFMDLPFHPPRRPAPPGPGRALVLAALPPWPSGRPRQPMNIEADALRHDDQQQPVFTGNVVVTKGTIVMRGAAGGAPGRRGLPAA